jgi:DNA invertase Pin-like site-specific DNA recombinase
MTPRRKRAAIYVRISRDREGAGLGVERQEAECRDLVAGRGWSVAEVFRDNDLSAYSGKPRPGYRAMLDAIAAGTVDVVVAWHTDRLHRAPAELESYIGACEPRNVATHTVKAGDLDLSTASGRMMARMLGAVARHDVEHNIERITSAKAQAAAAGKYRGGRRPYGYEADGLTVRPPEAAVVVRIADRIIAGASVRSIVAELNTEGATTSTGGPWRTDAVVSVIKRARNAGLIEQRGQVLGPAQWPAILDEDTWRAVLGILGDPARRTNPGGQVRWLLSGIARCGECGAGCHVTNVGSRPSLRGVPSYCCPDKHVVRNAAELDAFVAGLIVARLSQPDAVDLLLGNTTVDTGALHTELTVIRERLDGLAREYAEGTIDARQLAAGSAHLRAREVDVTAAIADASRGSVLSGVVAAPDVAEVWNALPLGRRRAIIEALVTVTVLRAQRGRRPGWRPGESYFDPRAVAIEWQ